MQISQAINSDPQNNQPYVLPVMFDFNGNNIFISIDNKPKN